MKTNSSKNRKSNLPAKSKDSKIEGITRPQSNENNSKGTDEKLRHIENIEDRLLKIFKDDVNNYLKNKQTNLQDKDLTEQVFLKQIELMQKKQQNEEEDFEKKLKDNMEALNLSEMQIQEIVKNKKAEFQEETDKQIQELRKQLGLKTQKEKNDEVLTKISDKFNEQFEKIGDKFNEVIKKNNESLKGAFLGSLNLITAPLEDFFGFDTLDLIKNAFGIGNKKTKKKPTTSDVQKKGDDGALLLNNTLFELFGKKKKKNEKETILGKLSDSIKNVVPALWGFIKNIPILGTALRGFGLLGKSFGKNVIKGKSLGKFFASGATKTALKSISPLAIITSIIMMVVDGIKGIFKAKEWGVPKASAFIGAFLGGTEKGAKGAFANMGKWALMGVGIGTMVAPGIGTIVGGVVGSVIGAVLGIFGGENIAKFVTELGAWIIKPFKEIGNIWKDEEGTVMKKIGKTLGKIIVGIISLPYKFYGLMFSKIHNWFTSKKEQKKREKEMKKQSKPKKSPIGDFFKGLWNNITKGLMDFLRNPIAFNVDIGLKTSDKLLGMVWDFVAGLIEGIFGVETISWKDFKTQISDVINKYVLEPMFNVFGICRDFFDMLFHKPSLIWKAIWDKNYDMGDAFEEFANSKQKVEQVNDAIIKKDGTIIRTSEDDNLIATKNNPTKITSMSEFNADRLRDVMNSSKDTVQIDYTNKFDKMIGLLEKLLDKELVVNGDNSQSLSDLRVLAGGYNVGY